MKISSISYLKKKIGKNVTSIRHFPNSLNSLFLFLLPGGGHRKECCFFLYPFGRFHSSTGDGSLSVVLRIVDDSSEKNK